MIGEGLHYVFPKVHLCFSILSFPMSIYLPIAQMSIDIFLLLAIGGGVGFLSGLFGIGGGFLITPLLMFLGIPPPVAVGTGANQVIASSVTGVVSHWQRNNVDVPMGILLLIGGLMGSSLGVMIFGYLRAMGQVDLVLRMSYVVFLGIIGIPMLIESIRVVLNTRRGVKKRGKLHEHYWFHALPFRMRFYKSRLYISALLPVIIGFFIGIVTAMMGVGGGFMLVPAMIYILGMPTSVVLGTSLFQIIFVSSYSTFLHAYFNQSVDIVLATVLLVTAVFGTQIGIRIGSKMRAEQLRALLAIVVLSMAVKLLFDLFTEPVSKFVLFMN